MAEKANAKFWSWYLGGLGRGLATTFQIKWMKSWPAELAIGEVILLAGSGLLGVFYSWLWLLATIPIGTTLMAHAIWRFR